jgi:tetrahydromethanopterin S-methyltransferase subunit C
MGRASVRTTFVPEIETLSTVTGALAVVVAAAVPVNTVNALGSGAVVPKGVFVTIVIVRPVMSIVEDE